MSKEKLIPEFRFPEFANNGKWDNKPISKLGETVNGLSGKKGADFGSGRPYVQYKQVFDKSFIDFTECGKVDVGENENQNQLQLGDILFTTSSETPDEVGFASVINKQPEEPTYLNSFCFILRPNDLNEINPGFSRYLFHSPIYRKSVSAIAQGSTRYNLSKKAFLKLRVPVPSTPEEQQKIASCLSSLDEVIELHTQKLELLQEHKKGLLQNLFPQEGESVPKVRFSEFEGDGEWELKPFSKFIKLYRGSSPRPIREYLTKEETGVNWIKIGDTSSITDFVIRSVSEKITPKGAEKSRRVKKGELILANSMSYGSTYLLEVEGCIYDGWFVLREYEEHFDKQFLLQLLNSEYTQGQYKRFAAGGIVQNISSEIVYSITLSKTSKEEQQKIASCLSALDELITAQQDKIEQLQQHKKGLMQGLFPKIND